MNTKKDTDNRAENQDAAGTKSKVKRMKHLYISLLDLKLKWKLILALLLTTVIPYVFFIAYTYSNTKTLMIDQSYHNMEMNLDQTNTNIQNKLMEYADLSSVIYMNKTILNHLTVDYTVNGHEDLYYFIRNYFSEMTAINAEVDELSIYTTNISVPQDMKYLFKATPQVQDQAWFKQAVEHKGQVVYMSTSTNKKGKLVFSLVRLLNNYYLSLYDHVLKIDISEDHLYALIPQNNRNGSYMVLDENDRIATCNDKTIIGKPVTQVLRVYEGKLENNKRQTAMFQGEEMLIRVQSMDNGWKTISMVSQNNILEEARNKAFVVFIFGMVSILFAVLMASILITLLTRRIERLTAAVKLMDEGHFGIELPEMGGDEIGILSKKFSQMSFKIKHLINEVYEKELIRQNAELTLLQEQINPHFLYNALSSISALSMRSGDQKTNEMIHHLSDFYRISLNKGKQTLTVRDEINLLKSYLNVQYVRFGDRIDVAYELDEALMDYRVIKMVLQPIVENAIHHGRIDEEQILKIRVKLFEQEEQICFEVSDNGTGIDADTVASLNQEIKTAVRGYGLKNVSIRIQLQYGNQYGLQVVSIPGEGTRVLIRLPKVLQE